MGLDLQFNRTAALAAGLQLSVLRNGSDACIFMAKQDNEAPEYIAWLETYSECVEVPDLGVFVTNDGWDDTISIRANQWGRVYAPMTNWLKANNIEWSEV